MYQDLSGQDHELENEMIEEEYQEEYQEEYLSYEIDENEEE
jgi:hypothetical protein